MGNLLGKKLNCQGNEAHFHECPSDFTDITGLTLTHCPEVASGSGIALLCNPGALLSASNNQISSIRGAPHVTIDLEVRTHDRQSYYMLDLEVL